MMSRTKAVVSTMSTVLIRTTDAVMTQEMKRPEPSVDATAKSRSTVPPALLIAPLLPKDIGYNRSMCKHEHDTTRDSTACSTLPFGNILYTWYYGTGR